MGHGYGKPRMSERCFKCGHLILQVGDRVQFGSRSGVVANTGWPSNNMVFVRWDQPEGSWIAMSELIRTEKAGS